MRMLEPAHISGAGEAYAGVRRSVLISLTFRVPMPPG